MTKQAVIEMLIKARALLAQGWCQGSWAKDAANQVVSVRDDKATQWDLLGAIYRVNDYNEEHLDKLFNRLIDKRCTMDKALDGLSKMTWWNDKVVKDKSEVLSLIDEAIASLMEKTHEQK